MAQVVLGNQSSQDWVSDCMETYGRVLTGASAHWCWDYDGLPIDETCDEFENCTCNLGGINGVRPVA